jgi:tetratricopeptide (TPR) repeat protein
MPQRIYLFAGLLMAGLLFLSFTSAFADKAETKDRDKAEMKRLAHLGYNNLSVDTELSLEYFNQLESLASEKQDSVYWAYALKTKVLVYLWQLNYPAALRSSLRANQITPEDNTVILNLANLHRLSGNIKEALYYYDLYNENTSPKHKHYTVYLSQMMLLYLENGKDEEAFEYVDQILPSAKNSEDSIRAFLDYGYFYLNTGHNEMAGDYLRKAEEKLPSCENLFNIAFLKAALWSNLGQYYLNKENYPESESYMLKAIEFAEKRKVYYFLEDAYIGMQKIAAHQNDHAKLELYQQKERDFNKTQKARLTEYFEELVKYKEARNLATARRLEKTESETPSLIATTLTITGLLIILLAAALIYHRKRVKQLNRKLIISESYRAAEEKQKLIYEARLATHLGQEDELPDEA